MKPRKEIEDILRPAMPALRREFGIRRLALFGSYARGDAAEGSDVDVLVDVDPSIGLRFVDLAEPIEALLGVRVHVVSRRAISPRHWPEIEKELVDVAWTGAPALTDILERIERIEAYASGVSREGFLTDRKLSDGTSAR
jgi:uncharacterized protein